MPTIDQLILTPYFQGDPLFPPRLARSCVARTRAGKSPLVILHDGGEEVTRYLESKGYDTEQPVGLTDEDQIEIDRLVRGENRRLTAMLNDEGVAATGMMPDDRGIMALEDDGVRMLRIERIANLVSTKVHVVLGSSFSRGLAVPKQIATEALCLAVHDVVSSGMCVRLVQRPRERADRIREVSVADLAQI